MYRAGIDIGGTFTDMLLVSEDGSAVIGKTLTTPADPSLAVENALKPALQNGIVNQQQRGTLIHGTTLVTNALIEKEPAMVKAFNQAMVRSLVYACDHRDEAVRMFLKHNPLANPDTARAQLDVAIQHLLVDEVTKNGVGPMSERKMKFTLDVVREFYGLKGPVEVNDTYTNAFVTPGQKVSTT